MEDSRVSRRGFLVSGTVLGAGSVVGACASADAGPTPEQTEGPFYPIAEQADKDADLTLVNGRTDRATGVTVFVEGRVLDTDGNPIADAVVDVWQANAAGRYAHERDPNPAPLDPNFQGWAIISTDSEGRYGFKTVKPGAYPVEDDWSRPPHIHFKVSRRGYREVTTQMYFDGEALNDVDRILNALTQEQRTMVVARQVSEGAPFNFDVILEKA
ncbi:MAG: protocatechuate 3,4-dioxygenase subunit alpha [Hyphomonadaceae bacterium]|nr:protocatechuate 3,4-dioxygenase subunit alpha [Hyphomonadaceae bacterium]